MNMKRSDIAKKVYQSAHFLSMNNQEYRHRVLAFLERRLRLDLGSKGDVTTNSILDSNKNVTAHIRSKSNGILAGIEEITPFYELHGINVTTRFRDGDKISKDDILIELKGSVRDINMTERVGLNLLQLMSGIATISHKYSSIVPIAATRKEKSDEWIEKKAVSIGGGFTHRLGLGGFVMIKDNTLSALQLELGISKDEAIIIAIDRAYESDVSAIEIEVETCDEALTAAACFRKHGGLISIPTPIIMLDNFQRSLIAKIASKIFDAALIEVSGGINLENIENLNKCPIDIISTSRIQNSDPLDFSQKIQVPDVLRRCTT